MTDAPKRRGAVTRAEFDEMHGDLADVKKMVADMHQALMTPAPPHKDSLLDRMATTTVYMESGRRVGVVIIWGAGVLAALGAAFAAFRFGAPPN